MTDKKKPEMIQSKPNFAKYSDSFVKNAAGKNDVIKNSAIKTDRTAPSDKLKVSKRAAKARAEFEASMVRFQRR